MPERVFITGGAGYLGGILVPHLLKEGYAVRVLDRFQHKNLSLMQCIGHEGFEPVRGDCRDKKTLEKCLEGTDFVIPLAAIVGAPACEANSSEAWSTNWHAIAVLTGLVSFGGQKILFPNTNSSYGTTGSGEVCDEDSPVKPLSVYAETKLNSEKFLLKVLPNKALSFRLATAFGPSPRMRLDLLVNDFTYRAVKDKAVVLYEAHFRRNYIHVYDIARLFVFGMRNFDKLKGKPWNAGLHYCLNKFELCQEIQKAVPDFHFFDADVGTDPDRRDYNVSVARLEEQGFKCHVSLARGIRELVQAYQMLPCGEYRNA